VKAGDKDVIIPSAHFLTPETAKTTHYFIRGGHNVKDGPAGLTEGMRINTLKAFRE
jgi:hypothetical protein